MESPSFKKAVCFWTGIALACRENYILLRKRDGGRFYGLNRKHTGFRDNPANRAFARRNGYQVVGVCRMDGTFRPNKKAFKGA